MAARQGHGTPALTFDGEPADDPAAAQRDRADCGLVPARGGPRPRVDAPMPDRRRSRGARPPRRRRWPDGELRPSRLPRRVGRGRESGGATRSPRVCRRDRGEHPHPRRTPHERAVRRDPRGASSAPRTRGRERHQPIRRRIRTSCRTNSTTRAMSSTALWTRWTRSRSRSSAQAYRAVEGGRPGRLASPTLAARLRPRSVRAHLPLLAQLAGPDDRERRTLRRAAARSVEPAGRARPGDAPARDRSPSPRSYRQRRSCSTSTLAGSGTGTRVVLVVHNDEACVEARDHLRRRVPEEGASSSTASASARFTEPASSDGQRPRRISSGSRKRCPA